MKSNPEILVIDDELSMRKLLEITLCSHDFSVVEASTGGEGIDKAVHHPPELVLLDLGLPDMSGQEVLRALRQWYLNPILILSAQSGEQEIVRALDHGANDYLIKPFRTGELLARIRSALRFAGQASGDPLIEGGRLLIDLSARTVKKDQEPVRLTSTEYNLLALLARNEGKVLTHAHILKEIWGPTYSGQTQYLRVFIAQLRKKIEDNPNQPHYIHTEAGVGYRFRLSQALQG